ncbi:hypothetical protein CVIRNUC_006335 [Coccomyxa viridis]|uniref:Uncharacterized protein n=1 Tax=Coccomyxa viridis TaxID=1274662 RepID=A0AAV1IB24_9CHLO|nr:hypothetical protein CVIRNUC_006335 [Coccomyxa viridis]
MLSKAGHAPMHDMGRKLMQAHHCSGGDTVVGSANVSSSLFAMLFVGWLVGLAMGAGVALYMRTRQSRNRRAVTDPISPTAPKPVPSWAQNIRHGKTPSAAIRDEAVRTSGAEGPLGVGLVFQSINSEKGGGQLHSLAVHPHERWSSVDLKGEQQGAPAAKSAGLMIPLPLELPARPYSLEPLAVKVDATGDRAAKDRAAQPEAGNAGTIKAAWPGRRSERSLAGSSLYSSSHTDAMSIREAAAAQRGSAPAAGLGRPMGAPPKPPPLPPTGRAARPAAGAPRPNGRQAPPQALGAHSASSTQAREAAAPPQASAGPAADTLRRKQDEKSKAAAAVAPAYDLDDLDDEWKALLNELEDRLLQQGAQGMDATDRAVAIRTLIVSTAREAPEVALESALKQILRYRKAAA